jgi:hypothetical protein
MGHEWKWVRNLSTGGIGISSVEPSGSPVRELVI